MQWLASLCVRRPVLEEPHHLSYPQVFAADGQISAFRHTGFWQAMDTLREKHQLEALWTSGKAPWKTWE